MAQRKIIHQISYCHDCDFREENYRNGKARKKGYIHAKNTGHTVTVETGTATTYN